MEISRLRDIQPDRDRPKGSSTSRRGRRAPDRKTGDAQAPAPPEAPPEPGTEPPHRIDVTA